MRAAILAIAVLAFGCGAIRPPVDPAQAVQDRDLRWTLVPQVASRSGLAHLCPYAPHHAYTARHVILEYQANGDLFMMPLIWKQGEAQGMFVPAYVDARRDLAIGWSREAFPYPFPVAKEPPKPGDKLYVASYDWGRSGAPRKRGELKAVEIGPAMLRLDSPILPGSSGSCLCNQAGEIVGIIFSGVPGTGSATTMFAVGVWGEWGQIPEEWRDWEAYGWRGYGGKQSSPPEEPPR